MDQTQIRNEILRRLYQASFSPESYYNLNELMVEQAWDSAPFWNLVNRMSQEHLIASAPGGSNRITASGVAHTEDIGIAPEDLVKANKKARMQILLALAKIYEERGSLYSVLNSELYRQTDVGQNQATANLLVLHGLNFVEPYGNGGSRLTSRGYSEVERHRSYRSIIDEFESISEMKPQPRGLAVQKLIAKIVERHGWGQDVSVKTSNEEMDVIIFRDREYYLLESKWVKDPVEAPVVRELVGKLANRIGVRGIIASMSGFTQGAVKEVHDSTGRHIILLFGKEDVNALVYGQSTFDELLNSKYKALVTKRVVEFS